MQQLNRTTAAVVDAYPEVIIQFGGGNFVRAFTDWIIDVYNEKNKTQLGVLVATTTQRTAYTEWNNQDGLYHLLTKGLSNGKIIDDVRLIKSVSRIISMDPDWETFLRSAENPVTRYVISNTTEAGITFNATDEQTKPLNAEFPAKLTLWLYRRFEHFGGSHESGCVFFPVELIDNNGAVLQDILLQYASHWNLGGGFASWLKKANYFCNSLVDRIVPGVGREEMAETLSRIGYADKAVTQGEPYHLWAIEAPAAVRKELPLDQLGLNVIFTEDLAPYRLSKVRILNGAHTTMVPVGLLYGLTAVREVMEDDVMGKFLDKAIFTEIIPSLELPEMDLEAFANDILDRFRNPFIYHLLASISLNSMAKFGVRVLPSILDFQRKKGALPPNLVLAFACLIRFYRGSFAGREFTLNDQPWATSFMQEAWLACDDTPASVSRLVDKVLAWERAWGQDLSEVPGLNDELSNFLLAINGEGLPAVLNRLS